MLETHRSFRIVADTEDGLEAMRSIERLKPRVLVVSRFLPSLNGLEITRQVNRRFPQTKVLMIASDASVAGIALRTGVTGFILDTTSSAKILAAIGDVVLGRQHISPQLSPSDLEARHRKSRPVSDRYETLTTREREVLQLVAEGHTSNEVAHRLFISPRTVEIHRANMMRKLNLRTQTDLVRFAIVRGILPDPG